MLAKNMQGYLKQIKPILSVSQILYYLGPAFCPFVSPSLFDNVPLRRYTAFQEAEVAHLLMLDVLITLVFLVHFLFGEKF